MALIAAGLDILACTESQPTSFAFAFSVRALQKTTTPPNDTTVQAQILVDILPTVQENAYWRVELEGVRRYWVGRQIFWVNVNLYLSVRKGICHLGVL